MKLHLGCWHRYIEGFYHIDLCDLPHIDYKSSVDRLPFLDNQCASLIYASHVFEYFDLTQAPEVLAEWARVLKPGGILRLSVPDFDQLMKVYAASNDLTKILGPLFGRMQIANTSHTIFHKMVYNSTLLIEILERGGFVDCERWDWRQTEHSHIDDHSQAYFPHMDKEDGIQISLNIECRKPNYWSPTNQPAPLS